MDPEDSKLHQRYLGLLAEVLGLAKAKAKACRRCRAARNRVAKLQAEVTRLTQANERLERRLRRVNSS